MPAVQLWQQEADSEAHRNWNLEATRHWLFARDEVASDPKCDRLPIFPSTTLNRHLDPQRLAVSQRGVHRRWKNELQTGG